MRTAIAVGAAALLVVVATASWWAPSAERAGSVTGVQPGGEGRPALVEARPARRAGTVVPEPPRSVRLPTGTVVSVRAVSTRPDGLLGVPRDIRRAGWWRGGSSLGDPLGSTLIAAHVDSTTQGLGPFASLLTVRPGQRFVLTSATLRQTFRTVALRLVPRPSLERHRSLYGVAGTRRLVLVTCAPPYLPDRGGYQNLALVTAVPVSPPIRRRG